LATPLALVEAELNFDKNPRLATVVGLLFGPRPPAPTKTENEQNNQNG
jgi:hypothetical protein